MVSILLNPVSQMFNNSYLRKMPSNWPVFLSCKTLLIPREFYAYFVVQTNTEGRKFFPISSFLIPVAKIRSVAQGLRFSTSELICPTIEHHKYFDFVQYNTVMIVFILFTKGSKCSVFCHWFCYRYKWIPFFIAWISRLYLTILTPLQFPYAASIRMHWNSDWSQA